MFSAFRSGAAGVRWIVLWLIALLSGWGFMPVAGAEPDPSANTLNRKVLDLIQESTFEVVVRKPTQDSLSYEKPLPLDLLPYAVRTDKYYSVGTAFAIAPNVLASAAHVFDLASASQHTDVVVRDKDGQVYAIDKVLKYSHRQDFIVFSIKNRTVPRVFEPNTRAPLNAKVFAVGNAYGQGIVIRDGLYTSNTPEERDGAWKWMRFSAAASPGNSGGPLLDADGRLIGIVMRKSENENLNFALPIGEMLDAKDRLAVLDMKMGYRIDNMPMTKYDIVRHEIALPKSVADLRHELVRVLGERGAKLMDATFRENRDDIFPHGKGSVRLLHSNFSSTFPGIIGRGSDGNWNSYTPEKTHNADLGSNGQFVFGEMWNATYFRLLKPDDMPLQTLIRDSRKFMDLVLKGINYRRTIGSAEIKITSLGKARQEYVHTDGYQRRWLVRAWQVEFSDQTIVAMFLPAPGRLHGAIRAVPTGEYENHLRDMKKLADFTYISYYGTFEQWQEYLAMKDLLPAAFADIRMSFDYGKEFRYRSKRLEVAYPASLMKITRNSDLQVGFSYFNDNGKVVWDVTKVVVGEDKNTGFMFSTVRVARPDASLNDDFKSNWNNLASGMHPFNRTAFVNNKNTAISTVGSRETDRGKLAGQSVLYAVAHSVDGGMDQQTAESRLDGFIRGLAIREGGATATVATSAR